MAKPLQYKSTADITVAKNIVDQVIGQEAAVNLIKKAALQRRHVFLIGEPGTGKSMLGLALAELLPKEKLVDTLAFFNPNDENAPLIRAVPAGQGRQIVAQARLQSMSSNKNMSLLFIILGLFATLAPYFVWRSNVFHLGEVANAIVFSASMVTAMFVVVGILMSIRLGNRMGVQTRAPKVIVDNYGKKQAPFFDATGAHAGALLGDVLHDPFQCFIYSKIYIVKDMSSPAYLKSMAEQIDELFLKHKDSVTLNQQGYKSVFLARNELSVLGELNGSICPVEVLSCNSQEYDGEIIRFVTSGNNEITITPKHKIAVNQNGRIVYKQAKDLIIADEIISKPQELILDAQDIINTYDKRQQEQCKLYYMYMDIKSKNPSWGYKRIAKAMNQPEGKTRWWHAKKHIPVPLQTVNWLREKGLLPLWSENLKLPLIAKVLGSTFGDGGIFQNINGIFLSSSELEATKEFAKDLETVFGLSEQENSRIIEGGEKGHSWCYQNNNRNIIRFFLALGAPRGNKTNLTLEIPQWIYFKEKVADEFFGSFFGSELGAPKVHIQKNRLQTLDLAITGPSQFEVNRIEFLNRIKIYLETKGVISTSLIKRRTKNEKLSLYRLLISTKFDNVVNFVKNVKINYCDYKRKKIVNAINELSSLKREKYEKLLARNYGAERIMGLLQLTPKSLYLVLNGEKIES